MAQIPVGVTGNNMLDTIDIILPLWKKWRNSQSGGLNIIIHRWNAELWETTVGFRI